MPAAGGDEINRCGVPSAARGGLSPRLWMPQGRVNVARMRGGLPPRNTPMGCRHPPTPRSTPAASCAIVSACWLQETSIPGARCAGPHRALGNDRPTGRRFRAGQQRDIYPPPEQAAGDLAAALKQAAAEHRRVILDFGGNWCTDCQVLDTYFHDAANKPILDANYILVHINIGRKTSNLDIADRYEIPLKKGVPALAVLDAHGKLLYSQNGGEFEAMRRMDSSAVTRFLVRWKHGKA